MLAGDCTVRFNGDEERVHRGYVVTVVKPDRTTLVHDAAGYQPVAWLTRPDAVTVDTDPRNGATTEAGFGVTARADDRLIRVRSHSVTARTEVPVSPAGRPVGRLDDAPLVRADGAIRNLDTGAEYPLVAGATVLDESCDACGLPRMRVERGAVFEVCVDRACEPLDDAVRAQFDRVWTCPDCGDDLRILRRHGRLLAGCDAHPDCETAFSVPAGVVVDDCACGLPVFETTTGRRCLDGTCDRH